MRGWFNLPHAVPVLLRHFGAYVELARADLAASQRHLARQLAAIAVAALAAGFGLLLACVAVIAAAWDTTHRMAVIYALIGAFALVALAAALVARRAQRSMPQPFASVKREWEIDRALLEEILAANRPPGAATESDHE